VRTRAHERSGHPSGERRTVQAKFCLPLMVVPSNQRRRSIDTMSVHIGMKGAACLVEAQSVSSNGPFDRNVRTQCGHNGEASSYGVRLVMKVAAAVR
jgi:hypothetical protein